MKTVQTLLGHESAKLTLDTHAGLFESDLDQLSELMSDGSEASGDHWALTDNAPVPAGVGGIRNQKAIFLHQHSVRLGRFELPTPALGERCSIP